MSEPFIGEIIMGGFNFAPKNFAFCDGALIPISQNTALFSILGTMYGGDGRTTFGLPDLRGRVAVGAGSASGLSPVDPGQSFGTETVTLTANELPSHGHTIASCVGELGEAAAPTATAIPARSSGVKAYAQAANGQLAVASSGGGLPHNNMMPYTVINFCIATLGVFPPRS